MGVMELTTDVRPLTRHITVNLRLRGVRRMRLRLWLARLIIRFGARVGNLGYRVETEGRE